MKTLHFTSMEIGGEKLAKRLRKDRNRTVAFMSWADAEIVEAFNRGEYTDLVTTYLASATGFKVNADIIVHDNLPIACHDEPFVKQANCRAQDASIIYRYDDHFEYEGAPG